MRETAVASEGMHVMPAWPCRRRLELSLHGRVSDQLLWKCLKGKSLLCMLLAVFLLPSLAIITVYASLQQVLQAFPRRHGQLYYPGTKV